MARPYTVRHGSWAPDLANNGIQVAYEATSVEIPSADCNNVYYQDSSFRCLPGPSAIGPAAPAAILNAFTYYDEVSDEEVIFAGTSDGVYALINGAWVSIPLNVVQIVQGTGVSARFSLANLAPGANLSAAFGLGHGTARGQIYDGTMTAALLNAGDNDYGFASSPAPLGGYGGLMTPPVDVGDNVIDEWHSFGGGTSWYIALGFQTPFLGQSYFSSIKGAGVTAVFLGILHSNAANVTYQDANPGSRWVWGPFTSQPTTWAPGNNYHVTMNF